MSQRVLRIIFVGTALAACDAPSATPTPPPTKVALPVAVTPTPPPQPVQDEPEAPPDEPPPPITPAVAAAVATSLNQLSLDLHRVVARRPGNVFSSGLSVSLALAMVHAGSGGATRKQLAKSLHLGKLAEADLQAGLANLRAGFGKAKGGVTLVVANRLFGEQSLAFKPAYLELGRAVFGAPLEALDFINNAGGATARINGWVGEQTRGKIANLLPSGSLDASTRLVLTNAVYFKADWQEPFEPGATRPQSFFAAAGKREVPMMRSSQRLRLAAPKGAKLRVLELPYAGGEYALVIVLPQAKDGLAAIEKRLSLTDLQAWIDGASDTLVDVQLPRFTLEQSVDLDSVLAELDLGDLFKPRRADLSGMADAQLSLSAAFHRGFVAVDERGSEAAAASAITVKVTSVSVSVPFVVDRPFLFLIRDTRTGLIVFLGRVADPPA